MVLHVDIRVCSLFPSCFSTASYFLCCICLIFFSKLQEEYLHSSCPGILLGLLEAFHILFSWRFKALSLSFIIMYLDINLFVYPIYSYYV